MKKIITTTLITGSLFWAGQVYAGSPTSFVSGPGVTKGATTFEGRAGYSWDDGTNNDDRIQVREHFDHGFTDWYALRFIVAQDKRKGDNLAHDDFTVENRIQLFNKADDGWDGGFRFSYTKGDTSPDNIGVKLIGQFNFAENWQARHNISFSHHVGEDAADGMTFSLRHQITRDFTPQGRGLDSLRAGVEVFNDFGNLSTQSGYSDQDHQIGPVMKGGFGNGYAFETGYRIGVSDASRDHLVKFGLSKTF